MVGGDKVILAGGESKKYLLFPDVWSCDGTNLTILLVRSILELYSKSTVRVLVWEEKLTEVLEICEDAASNLPVLATRIAGEFYRYSFKRIALQLGAMTIRVRVTLFSKGCLKIYLVIKDI